MEVKKVPKVQFGDVARECRENYKGDQTGMPVVGLEHLEPETMTLHAWGTSADNNFTKCFHKGQVLFGRRRAYLKKAVVAPFDGICSGDITVIEAKADILNPELLPFIVQNDDFFRFAVGHSAGSLSPRVKWEHLQNYEFTLPSMAEQDELVELLRAMERTKNAYKELIIKTDELVKSQFVEMFGDPVKNEKSWAIKPIKELYSVGSSKRIYAAEQTKAGVPFLRVSDICSLIDGDNVQPSLYISEDKFAELESNDLVPTENDILVTSRGTIGRCYIIKASDKFYFQDGMVTWLKQKGFSIEPLYVSTLFAANSFSELLDKATNKTTVHYISIDKLAAIPIPVPPIELQKQFTAFVEHVDKSKFAAQQALADLTATQKALMRQYLG